MCYSAEVSFTTGGILIAMGVLILAIKKPEKKYLPIALVPFFFGFQQLSEGLVWQGYDFAKNIFLFFAFLFWPIYIPSAFLILEKGVRRKTALLACLGIGVATAVTLFPLILSTIPEVHEYSIHYVHGNEAGWPQGIAYVIATIFPFFITSKRHYWIFGILGILSALAVVWIDRIVFVSVWCYLAAVFSIILFLMPMRKSRNEH